MKIISVSNCSWINPEHTAFNCEALFEGLQAPVHFACNQSEVDVHEHTGEIWRNALAGMYGAIAEYVEPYAHAMVGIMTAEAPPAADVQPDSAQAMQNQQMWTQVYFEQAVAKALLKFGVVQSDPTKIPVSGL